VQFRFLIKTLQESFAVLECNQKLVSVLVSSVEFSDSEKGLNRYHSEMKANNTFFV